MGLLYFFETTIEFREMNPQHLFKRWLDIVEAFNEYPKTTTGVEIKQFWKVRLNDYSNVYAHSKFRPHRFAQNLNGFECISVLKAAKSDTERFAALLLVTQY